MKEDLLTVRNLKTYYFTSAGTVKAVDDVSLRVKRGDSVGLIGESGCGKSALALSILRLVPYPGKTIGGTILIDGKDVLKSSEEELRTMRGKKVSAVFQDPMTFLNPVMKVHDQISEALLVHRRVSKREARRMAVEALETVRIPSPEEVAMYYPYQLSGGMRQRVLIAMSLICNPSLLIADEPTTALDATIQAQILELIRKLKKEVGISLLLVTHDLGIVAETCDRCYVMYAGKIVESADVLTLFENPLHPYTKGLLQCVLSINEFKEELISIEGGVPDLTDLPSGCSFNPRCPFAKEICQERAPSWSKAERGHHVSCWLHSEES